MPSLKQLALISVVSSLGVFGGSLVAPIEARFIESITSNSIVTGTIFGVGSICFAFLSVYIGRLSDRVDRKNIILFGLVAGVLFALFYSYALSTLHLFGVKIVWAVSAAATGPVIAAYLQDFLEPYKSKGKYFGYVYALQSIAGSGGALLGGWVAQQFGLQAPFLVLASVYCLAFVAAWFFLQPSVHDPEIERAPQLTVSQTLRFIFTKPELLFYLSLNISFGINWGIKVFLWPLAIFALAGSDLLTGSLFATMGVVACVLLPFAGKFVDRFGVYRVSFFQFFLLALSGTGMALTDSLTVFWVLIGVYTIGEVLNLTQIVLFTESVPNEIRGAVVGLDAAMDQLLIVIAPFIAGFLIVAFGIQTTLLIFMSLYWVSLLCSGVVYLFLIRPRLVS